MFQGTKAFCITHQDDYYLLTRKTYQTLPEALKAARLKCNKDTKEIFVYKRDVTGYTLMSTITYRPQDIYQQFFTESKTEKEQTKEKLNKIHYLNTDEDLLNMMNH